VTIVICRKEQNALCSIVSLDDKVCKPMQA
jgi:hypothetical protein